MDGPPSFPRIATPKIIRPQKRHHKQVQSIALVYVITKIRIQWWHLRDKNREKRKGKANHHRFAMIQPVKEEMFCKALTAGKNGFCQSQNIPIMKVVPSRGPQPRWIFLNEKRVLSNRPFPITLRRCYITYPSHKVANAGVGKWREFAVDMANPRTRCIHHHPATLPKLKMPAPAPNNIRFAVLWVLNSMFLVSCYVVMKINCAEKYGIKWCPAVSKIRVLITKENEWVSLAYRMLWICNVQ